MHRSAEGRTRAQISVIPGGRKGVLNSNSLEEGMGRPVSVGGERASNGNIRAAVDRDLRGRMQVRTDQERASYRRLCPARYFGTRPGRVTLRPPKERIVGMHRCKVFCFVPAALHAPLVASWHVARMHQPRPSSRTRKQEERGGRGGCDSRDLVEHQLLPPCLAALVSNIHPLGEAVFLAQAIRIKPMMYTHPATCEGAPGGRPSPKKIHTA